MTASVQMVTLVPIRDMNRAIRFYTKKLGAKLVYRGAGDMKNFWAQIRLAGHDVWLVAPDKPERRKLAYTMLLVRNAKSYVRKLQASGVKFERAERVSPETKIDGPLAIEQFGTSAYLKDTEGNIWMVWQNGVPM